MIQTRSKSWIEPMIGEERPDADRRPEQRQGDVAQRLPSSLAPSIAAASCSSLRNALQAGQEEDDPEADVLPGDHDEQRVEDEPEVGEPELDEPAEADAPCSAASTRPPGWRICRKTIAVIASESTYGAKKTSRRTLPAAQRPVEQQRDAERERKLDRERERDEDRVVPHRLPERGVAERLAVVVETDEVGQRAEPVPRSRSCSARPGRPGTITNTT